MPSAKAVQLTMNRDGIRDFAAKELGLDDLALPLRRDAARKRSPRRRRSACPRVVKPVMSSSGKGQSVARTDEELGTACDYAVANMRGDRPRVIVEEFIDFDYEITLLTVATKDGVLFCPPIGHRQEAGDYRESWQPAPMAAAVLASAQEQAAQGRHRARRPRHVRRRILHRRRPGDLLRTVARARTTPAWSR